MNSIRPGEPEELADIRHDQLDRDAEGALSADEAGASDEASSAEEVRSAEQARSSGEASSAEEARLSEEKARMTDEGGVDPSIGSGREPAGRPARRVPDQPVRKENWFGARDQDES